MARPWPFTVRGTAARLFATCWLVYVIHSATNIAREHYLMFAIGDRFSFRVDEYQGLHPDLFEMPGRGWHINSNPGVSMLAALPYAVSRPVIEPIVQRVRAARAASGVSEPPAYDTPWPNSRAFFAEAWRRGLDVKFGLAALIVQMTFMAPISAGMAVVMFLVLRRLIQSDRTALWLALLYAFGTPVFFRTGFLNHNLLVGYAGFLGLLMLWRPGRVADVTNGSAAGLAGLCGGLAILLDYTGVVLLAGLLGYGLVRARSTASTPAFALWFAAGAAGPLLLLWFYQWASFGDPWQPAQRWMPNVAWADTGYRGLSWPASDLLWANLFDGRYGLFVSCPLVLLAFLAPWVDRGRTIARRETAAILLIGAAFWLFCGCVNYGRLQFNTGVRYMTSILPLLFVLSAVVLVRLPRWLVWTIVLPTGIISWSLAMHRDVERDFGVMHAVLDIFTRGPELPALMTVSRMHTPLGELLSWNLWPMVAIGALALVLRGVWWRADGRRGHPLTADVSD